MGEALVFVTCNMHFAERRTWIADGCSPQTTGGKHLVNLGAHLPRIRHRHDPHTA